MRIERDVGERKIVFRLPECPRLEQFFALWLLEKYAQENFPVQDEIDLSQAGALDEIVETLSLVHDPIVEKLLKYVRTRAQAQKGTQPFELYALANTLVRYSQDNLVEIYESLGRIFEALVKEQEHFFDATKHELAEAEIISVESSRGELKVVVVQSDNLEFQKVARAEPPLGVGAALVIQKHTKEPLAGNVQIFSDRRRVARSQMDDLVRMLRIEEQRAEGRGGREMISNWFQLLEEEDPTGFARWHYLRTTQIILNGSPSHPEIEPTKLTLEQIKNFALIALSNRFDPSREKFCLQGLCTGRLVGNECPWYGWGLTRCRRIRSGMREQITGSRKSEDSR